MCVVSCQGDNGDYDITVNLGGAAVQRTAKRPGFEFESWPRAFLCLCGVCSSHNSACHYY